MRFLKRTEPTPDLYDSISDVPLTVIMLELRERGYRVIPDGAWEQTVGGLEARLAVAEQRLAQEQEKTSGVVRIAMAKLDEARRNGVRADACEAEIERFAAAFVASEFPELKEDTL